MEANQSAAREAHRGSKLRFYHQCFPPFKQTKIPERLYTTGLHRESNSTEADAGACIIPLRQKSPVQLYSKATKAFVRAVSVQ